MGGEKLNKYIACWVGGEAPVFLMSVLSGQYNVEKKEKIEARTIQEAYEKHTDESSENLQVHGDLVGMCYSGGHEGTLIINEICFGSLPQFKAKTGY